MSAIESDSEGLIPKGLKSFFIDLSERYVQGEELPLAKQIWMNQ